MQIAVVDYGMGNIRSVSKALERVAPQAQVLVTSDPGRIRAAERVVVPGQGAMPDCMRQLAASGAREAVVEATRDKPFLGICIGMQMLFDHGEEGDTPGLGLLAGEVPRFRDTGLKIPHMGWNQVRFDVEHPYTRHLDDGERFYFVHSYFPDPARAEDALERLGELLRFGQWVHQTGSDWVPLSREWGFVGTYLELERVRLGDRLRLEIEADPSALEVAVPPFALQPVVENAVKHGIAPRQLGGQVTVRATDATGMSTQASAHFTVTNAPPVVALTDPRTLTRRPADRRRTSTASG